jgi:hypothetical protein
VVFQSCDQFRVTVDFNGVPVDAVVDPGAALSCFGKDWLRDNSHVVFHPGTTAELCQLHEPRAVGGFFIGSSAPVDFMVRNSVVGVGEGAYPLNFQVVPGAAFNVTLGLDFLWGYAARLVPRNLTDPTSGAHLCIPVPPQYRKKGVPAKEPPEWVPEQKRSEWVPTCRVRGRYGVYTQRAPVTVVSPSRLAGL